MHVLSLLSIMTLYVRQHKVQNIYLLKHSYEKQTQTSIIVRPRVCHAKTHDACVIRPVSYCLVPRRYPNCVGSLHITQTVFKLPES